MERVISEDIKPTFCLSTSDYISFITKNSNMDWNTVCDFIYRKGYLKHDDVTYSESLDEPRKDRVDDHGFDYEYEFYKTHPFLKEYGVAFKFDD